MRYLEDEVWKEVKREADGNVIARQAAKDDADREKLKDATQRESEQRTIDANRGAFAEHFPGEPIPDDPGEVMRRLVSTVRKANGRRATDRPEPATASEAGELRPPKGGERPS